MNYRFDAVAEPNPSSQVRSSPAVVRRPQDNSALRTVFVADDSRSIIPGFCWEAKVVLRKLNGLLHST